MTQNVYVFIMAGGIGSRFWPESNSRLPKQFHTLVNERSLLQNTFDRFNQWLPDDHIFVVTSEDYRELTGQHLPTLKSEQIICEPMRRNTAPATLLGTLVARHLDPKSVCVFTPADATIADVDRFLDDVRSGAEHLSGREGILTLGIQPTEAHTGYGYVHFKPSDTTPYRVNEFKEKPDVATAQQYVESGEYLWNAGIFLWRTDYFLRLFETLAPEMYRGLSHLEIKDKSLIDQNQLATLYADLENISVDFLIMERAPVVYTIPGDFGWSDIGNWRALKEYLQEADGQNVVQSSKSILKNTTNCLIRSNSDKLIVVKGLSNYCIVENDDVLMIYPLESEQEIKQIRSEVEDKFGGQFV